MGSAAGLQGCWVSDCPKRRLHVYSARTAKERALFPDGVVHSTLSHDPSHPIKLKHAQPKALTRMSELLHRLPSLPAELRVDSWIIQRLCGEPRRISRGLLAPARPTSRASGIGESHRRALRFTLLRESGGAV